MKNNKKAITKVFYIFLVENGILFQFLDLIKTTRFTTLGEHCERCKVQNYIGTAWAFSLLLENAQMWINKSNEWREYIQKYYNQTSKTKKK